LYKPHLKQLIDEVRHELDSHHTIDVDFFHRLAAQIQWIETLFNKLYQDHPKRTEYFRALIKRLFLLYQERNDYLKNLDLDREYNPEWHLSERHVGMSLYVDRFCNDLYGLKQKTGYLKDLGANVVHLMPLLKSPLENDGGYAVSNFREVDERIGTMEALEDIARHYHDNGMLLVLDFVMNHTADDHEWAKKALAGNESFQEYYYMFDDRTIPDQFDASMPEIFPQSAPGNFTYLESIDQWVMTVFHSYQWDLNYTNPQVFIEMLANLIFLANKGADVIRMDALAFTWKEIGTESQNLPLAHTINQLMKACSQVIAPGILLLAEAIVAPDEIVKYFGEGSAWGVECDVAYNATLMALLWEAMATQDTRMLQKSMKGLPDKPYGSTWINYLRCHDDIGLGFDDKYLYQLGFDAKTHRNFLVDYYSGNFPGSMAMGAPFMHNPKTGDARISGSLASLAGLEKALNNDNQKAIDLSIQKIILLHSIILSYGGLVMLYSGDEIGTTNDYSYQNDPNKSYDNRWLHRPVMDWKKIKQINRPGTVEARIFHGLQKLITIRKSAPEFADKNSISIEEISNNHVLCYLRWDLKGRKILVLCNFSNQTQIVDVEILYRCGFDMINGLIDRYTANEPYFSKNHIQMNPYQFYWLTNKT